MSGERCFLVQEKEGICYLESSLFSEECDIFSGFSTRAGGVSTGAFSSLNLAFTTGDKIDFVRENRRRFFALWELKGEYSVSGNQVHGTNVHNLREEDCQNKVEDGVVIPDCDALVSNIRGYALTAYSADCFLVGMYEREKKVVALVHAGWRGVLGGILHKTVKRMEDDYSCNREKILTNINPGICYNCFEVGREVGLDFIKENGDYSQFIKEKGSNKFLLNLKGIIIWQLINCDLPAKNIYASDYCTVCRPDLFFSYRRDNGKTGRMTALLGLKKE